MFKSFFLTSFRHLMRNKLFGIINTLGLSIAVGCSIVVFLFVYMSLSFDLFHENVDRIFMIESNIERNGETDLYGLVPVPLGPALEADIPQVEKSVRVLRREVTVEANDNKYDEQLYFVDDGYFDMFSFPVIEGHKNALSSSSAAMITRRYAEKYFKGENAIGKEINVSLQDTINASFIVQAVVEDIPYLASFKSDIFLPFSKVENLGVKIPDDWTHWVSASFVMLNQASDVEILKTSMRQYIEHQNAANEDWQIKSFVFDPLANISNTEPHLEYNIHEGFELIAIVLFVAMAIVLLGVACINYANNTTVTMSRRFREIGVRKVIGGSRKSIAWQFIGENLLLCFFSLILGILLANYILIPTWVKILDMPLEFSLTKNLNLWIYLTLLLLFTGFATGAYPAFFVSKFAPVEIFRNRVRAGGQSLFIRILMTTQFVFTFVAIVFSVAIYQNGHYLKQCDWGFNYEGSLVLPINRFQNFEILKNEIEKLPHVTSVAGANYHINRSSYYETIKLDGKDFKSSGKRVGPGYIEAIGLRLNQGRLFEKENSAEESESIIVNQRFVTNSGMTQPLGQEIIFEDKTYTIIGVIDDYRPYGFDNEIYPTIFHLNNNVIDYSTIAVRIDPGNILTTGEQVKAIWKDLYPDTIYPGYFQKNNVDEFYDEYSLVANFLSFPIMMTILLTAMGIFGLISANIMNRRKEISIRKVLGASLSNIVKVVTKQLMWIIIIASAIAIVPGYYGAFLFLDELFNVYATPNAITMLISFAVVLLTSLIPLIPQIYRAANTNPTDALRSE